MKIATLSALSILAAQANALDFNDNVFDSLKYMTNYAKVAYCSVIGHFAPGDIEDSCPRMQFCQDSKDTDLVGVFKPNILELEISGDAYVAVDHSQQKVIAGFRGSISPGDWITDFLFGYCPYAPILKNDRINATLFTDVTKDTKPEVVAQRIEDNADEIPCKDCKVHCGVYVALTQFLQEVHDSAKPYLDQGYQLEVTGHSLGGGYSAMAGFEFLLAGYKPLTIAYSGLRVGNPAYNVYVDEKYNTKANAEVVANGGDLPIPSFSRLYQQSDIVPRLPPGPGYTHAGLNFQITKLRLPHNKENVAFLGATDNYENSPYDIGEDPLALLVAYQHIYLFQRVSWPCNDLLSKRDEDAWLELMKRGYNEEEFAELTARSFLSSE